MIEDKAVVAMNLQQILNTVASATLLAKQDLLLVQGGRHTRAALEIASVIEDKVVAMNL